MLKLNQPEAAWFLESTGDLWRSDNIPEFGIESRSAEIPKSLFNLEDVNLKIQYSFHFTGLNLFPKFKEELAIRIGLWLKGLMAAQIMLPKYLQGHVAAACECKTAQKIDILSDVGKITEKFCNSSIVTT